MGHLNAVGATCVLDDSELFRWTVSQVSDARPGAPIFAAIEAVKNDCFGRGLAVTSGVASAAVAGEGVFAARIVTSIAYVALPIARFVSVEVVELLLAASWQRAMVAIAGIVTVVNVAVKAAVAVKPGAGSNKEPTRKPVGSVIAVGCAVVWSIVKVAIGADGLHPNADRDLGCRYRRA
jgi:hypothetical protein